MSAGPPPPTRHLHSCAARTGADGGAMRLREDASVHSAVRVSAVKPMKGAPEPARFIGGGRCVMGKINVFRLRGFKAAMRAAEAAAEGYGRGMPVLARAEAERSLGPAVERLRASNPSLNGVRTSDVKAALLSAATGRKVSGRAVRMHESTARMFEADVDPCWTDAAMEGALTRKDIGLLATLPKEAQRRMRRICDERGMGPGAVSELIELAAAERASRAEACERSSTELMREALEALARVPYGTGRVEARLVAEAEGILGEIRRLV